MLFASGFPIKTDLSVHSSVLYNTHHDVWIPMWFERACAGADLQQYVVPVGHVMMNAVTAGSVGFPQGCYLGVKTCGSEVLSAICSINQD